MKNPKFAALASLTALIMLLPVVKSVNHASVTKHNITADGSGAPIPPFPGHPVTLADGSGAPIPPFPVAPNKLLADGSGAPIPPFPVNLADGSGAPIPPFPVAPASNLFADGSGAPIPPFPVV